MPLSEQNKLFAREYLVDFNATQAAVRANYSERTAKQQGSRLLTRVDVQEYLAELMSDRTESSKYDADWLHERLCTMAEMRVEDLFDDRHAVKPPSEWPEGAQFLVAGIDVEETFEGYGEDRVWTGQVKKIRLQQSTKVLELIGRLAKVSALRDTVHHHGLPRVTYVNMAKATPKDPDKWGDFDDGTDGGTVGEDEETD